MAPTLKLLNPEQQYVIKWIEFSYMQKNPMNMFFGNIFYARKFTDDYRFPYGGYVPNDALDDVIMDALKKKFEIIKVHTCNQTTDYDISENQKFYKQQNVQSITYPLLIISLKDPKKDAPIERFERDLILSFTGDSQITEISMGEILYKSHDELEEIKRLMDDTFVKYQEAMEMG